MGLAEQRRFRDARIRESSGDRGKFAAALPRVGEAIVTGRSARGQSVTELAIDEQASAVSNIAQRSLVVQPCCLIDLVDLVITDPGEEHRRTGRGVVAVAVAADDFFVVQEQVNMGMGDVPAGAGVGVHVDYRRDAVDDLR
ncbi:MAG: hypothetical protein ABRQ35_09225, partial [Smithellaceae bacterium]